MDLLADSPELNLSDKSFRIYSKNTARPPQFFGSGAVVHNSMISEGCVIHGRVENSVISGGVEIARDAYVSNSVILSDVKIESGARVCYSIVDSDAIIGSGVTVGKENAGKNDITVVAKGSHLMSSENTEKGVSKS